MNLPLTLVNPYCPRCGLAAYFDRPYGFAPHYDMRSLYWVICPSVECGWIGKSPRLTEFSVPASTIIGI